MPALRFTFAAAALSLLSGCAIVMASKLPIARPPNRLAPGVERAFVDRNYGYPVAGGLSEDGECVEQLQFVDGVPIGWKVARFCTHTVLDICTYGIWELLGTPIELANMNYPTYIYYVLYDSEGRIVKAVPADSEEGRAFSRLPWSSPYVDGLKVNKSRDVRNQLSSGAQPEPSAKPVTRAATANPAKTETSYVIKTFSRTGDDDFAYVFALQLKDGADAGLGALNRIKQDLRQEVVSDYVSAYGGNMGDVKVDFPEFSMKDSMIEGRAEVMRIAVKSLRYDAQAQKGVIAVKIGAHRFEDARMWVRKNIESLAKDKNVALTTGQIPPAARFYLGAERVLEGNVLEIEFETE